MARTSMVTAWTIVIALLLAAASAADTCRWEWAVQQPQGNNLHGVAYGAGRWVAVGDAGTIMTSTDREHWAVARTPTRTHLMAVAWGEDGFVVVGEAGMLLRSTDGLVWSRSQIPVSVTLHDVVWTGRGFVAVGDQGVVASGGTEGPWDTEIVAGAPLLDAVAVSADTIVAFGTAPADGNGPLIEVRQGKGVWQRVVPGGVRSLVAVTTNGELFVGVGTGIGPFASTAVSLWSVDGLAWYTASYPDFPSPLGVLWGGSQFFAYACGAIATSPDGIVWTAGRAKGCMLSVASGSGGYAGVGVRGLVEASDDGRVWRAISSGSDVSISTLTWAGTGFFALATEGGETFTAASDDGKTWHTIAPVDDEGSGLLAWDGEGLLRVHAPRAWRSSDGTSWSELSTDLGAIQPVFLARAGDRFIAARPPFAWGSWTLLSSSDGAWWARAWPPSGEARAACATDKEYVVVGGPNPVVCTSNDALVWTDRPLPVDVGASAYLEGVAWGRGTLVAVGRRGLIVSRPDGGVWQRRQWGGTTDLMAVVAAADGFVAAGADGIVISSNDGTTWRREALPTRSMIVRLVAGGPAVLAVDVQGSLLYRTCAPRAVRRLLLPR